MGTIKPQEATDELPMVNGCGDTKYSEKIHVGNQNIPSTPIVRAAGGPACWLYCREQDDTVHLANRSPDFSRPLSPRLLTVFDATAESPL